MSFLAAPPGTHYSPDNALPGALVYVVTCVRELVLVARPRPGDHDDSLGVSDFFQGRMST
jgi:hypothetical protein